MGIRLTGDVKRLMMKLRSLEDVNLRSSGKVMAEALRESTRARFKDEESPEGKAWKTSIRASEEGGVTLSKTAALKNSIKSRSDKSGFAVGTNLVYGKTHQYGDPGRVIRARTAKGLRFKINGRWINKRMVRVKIPARPYLGISEDDMLEIKRTLEDLISEA